MQKNRRNIQNENDRNKKRSESEKERNKRMKTKKSKFRRKNRDYLYCEFVGFQTVDFLINEFRFSSFMINCQYFHIKKLSKFPMLSFEASN